MKQIKAVIFDMDGVISNTVHLHYIVNEKVANHVGVSFNEEWNQKLQGLSRRATVEAIVEKSGESVTEDELEQLCELKKDQYIELINELTSEDAQPGIRSFIEELKKRSVKMVVASASQNAVRVLARLNLLDYFDGVVDVTKLRRGKPDPEIFLKAAEMINVLPSQCVAIEDGEAGLTGILQTEMFSVGVGSETSLRRADLTLSTTKELTVFTLEEALNERDKTISSDCERR
ncbi:beta-phosphoglucomutase [Halalkalibacter wakoensis JCM 9140]|uniref:Beta-phosphoglucomutase n=1 Tax=Halalkalibacter wakoensis JCM 9140 TaxID=1236970 RepID=W4Q411_9BACI|nr:beta-phosphoglucomutase [Halalkalibacter wakoensis]GAE26826.1 beta-phosphoglucomutase [Halalkalibacter wakoensis JCM 9140]